VNGIAAVVASKTEVSRDQFLMAPLLQEGPPHLFPSHAAWLETQYLLGVSGVSPAVDNPLEGVTNRGYGNTIGTNDVVLGEVKGLDKALDDEVLGTCL
jgi:hypothetical protein